MLEAGSYALVTRKTRYLRSLFPHYDLDSLEDGVMVIARVLCPGKTQDDSQDQEWLVKVGADTAWIQRKWLLPVDEVEATIFELLPKVGELYRQCRNLAKSTGQADLAETIQELYDDMSARCMDFNDAALQAATAKAAASSVVPG